MEKIHVNASKCYDVIVASGILTRAGEYFREISDSKKAVVVSDDTVFSLYGEALCNSLLHAGLEVMTFVFPHGEQSKSLSNYGRLLNAMCAGHVSRGDTVVALGGGVVGDLAGFAAATYQRGIGFVQIPTTLLAAVDSSVGGKTAINLDGGKNQAGAFYQPSLVLCDIDTLSTLPEREYRNGCAEIIKYAMLGGGLFEDISAVPVREQYETVIGRCVSMKRDYVEKDERDTGCRMMLNFGHTIGHAVEACSGYKTAHGEAVAIGMAMMAKAACAMGLCGEDTADKLTELIKSYGLPTTVHFSAQQLANAALADKKINGYTLTIIVPEKTGCCVCRKIDKDELLKWLKAGGAQ